MQKPEACGAERTAGGNAHDQVIGIKESAFSMDTTSGRDQPWG